MEKNLSNNDACSVPKNTERQKPNIFSAIKGIFAGVGSVLRPSITFYYWRKKVKKDGTCSETRITYKQE